MLLGVGAGDDVDRLFLLLQRTDDRPQVPALSVRYGPMTSSQAADAQAAASALAFGLPSRLVFGATAQISMSTVPA